jgi:hypothetical protein
MSRPPARPISRARQGVSGAHGGAGLLVYLSSRREPWKYLDGQTQSCGWEQGSSCRSWMWRFRSGTAAPHIWQVFGPRAAMWGRGGRLAEWPDAGRGFDADLAWACGPVWRLGRLSFGFMGPHSKHDADWTRQRSCTVGSGGHSGHSVMYITYVAFLLRVIISQGFQPLGSSVVVAQSTIRFVTERVRVPRATGGRDGRDDGWSWRARRSSGRR